MDLLNSFNTLAQSVMRPYAHRSEYISSSTLGIHNQRQLYGRILDPEYEDPMSFSTQRAVQAGTAIHELVQNQLGGVAGTEVYLEDKRNKVFGYLDVMLEGNIPVEIKTVSEKALSQLQRPKPAHVSQTNFYAVASEANLAYIMYVSRESPTLSKTFAIRPNYGMYYRDVTRIRRQQESIQGIPSSDPFISGFRPMASWLGHGINPSMMPFANPSDFSSPANIVKAMARGLSQLDDAGIKKLAHRVHERMVRVMGGATRNIYHTTGSGGAIAGRENPIAYLLTGPHTRKGAKEAAEQWWTKPGASISPGVDFASEKTVGVYLGTAHHSFPHGPVRMRVLNPSEIKSRSLLEDYINTFHDVVDMRAPRKMSGVYREGKNFRVTKEGRAVVDDFAEIHTNQKSISMSLMKTLNEAEVSVARSAEGRISGSTFFSKAPGAKKYDDAMKINRQTMGRESGRRAYEAAEMQATRRHRLSTPEKMGIPIQRRKIKPMPDLLSKVRSQRKRLDGIFGPSNRPVPKGGTYHGRTESMNI